MKREIGIVDYGIGNVKSIENALIKLNARSILTSHEDQLLNCDKLILPGVGAFKRGMENLQGRGLDQVITEFISTGKPLLGICLGMQMLFTKSEEFGTTLGLNLIEGDVRKIPTKSRLPHIGWTNLSAKNGSWSNSILETTKKQSRVYFVHTYAGFPDNESDYLAVTKYEGIEICAAVRKGNIYGTQFHPEKSGTAGLSILEKYISI
ncbi:MAG: imidazole glycerol phosphate synthase subunit HisH [Cyclobacteriaceae bacterium]